MRWSGPPGNRRHEPKPQVRGSSPLGRIPGPAPGRFAPGARCTDASTLPARYTSHGTDRHPRLGRPVRNGGAPFVRVIRGGESTTQEPSPLRPAARAAPRVGDPCLRRLGGVRAHRRFVGDACPRARACRPPRERIDRLRRRVAGRGRPRPGRDARDAQRRGSFARPRTPRTFHDVVAEHGHEARTAARPGDLLPVGSLLLSLGTAPKGAPLTRWASPALTGAPPSTILAARRDPRVEFDARSSPPRALGETVRRLLTFAAHASTKGVLRRC